MKIEPLNDEHRLNIGIALGLAAAANFLRKEREIYAKLPGYNTAIALIETIEAQQRADVAGMNFRAVAAAGIDVRTHMVGMIRRGEIYAEPMDLTEMAEFAPASVDRSGEADETSTKIEGSAEGESAVTAEGGQTPKDKPKSNRNDTKETFR